MKQLSINDASFLLNKPWTIVAYPSIDYLNNIIPEPKLIYKGVCKCFLMRNNDIYIYMITEYMSEIDKYTIDSLIFFSLPTYIFSVQNIQFEYINCTVEEIKTEDVGVWWVAYSTIYKLSPEESATYLLHTLEVKFF